MKATTLARLIEECDNHALTDYYYFHEVKPIYGCWNINGAFGFGTHNVKVQAGIYLIFSSCLDMEWILYHTREVLEKIKKAIWFRPLLCW